MASIFSKIVAGDIPCYKVAENDHFLAFLDINPLVKGHTLVIPKQEIDDYFDLPDELMADMSVFTKKVAHGIKQVIPCFKVGIMVIGDEVPHAHVHLLPFTGVWEAFNLRKKRLKLSQEEFVDIAAQIAAAIEL